MLLRNDKNVFIIVNINQYFKHNIPKYKVQSSDINSESNVHSERSDPRIVKSWNSTLYYLDIPVKYSANSCSSFCARSYVFTACSSVIRLLISLSVSTDFGFRNIAIG